jgi:predicted site-specific integrase-resolvase
MSLIVRPRLTLAKAPVRKTYSSNSEVYSSTSESESDVGSLSTTSESDDGDQVETRSNSPNRSVSRIAYLRVPSAVSTEEKAKLKAILARYDATAMLILDVQQKRAPFQQRAGLKRLFQLVLKGQVDEILVASSTQLCNTKEGFELIEWTCQMLGARVLIVPSLDVL